MFTFKVAGRLSVFLLFLTTFAAASDIPGQFSERRLTTSADYKPEQLRSSYFWTSSPAGSDAQLLTLFCRSCFGWDNHQSEVPLVSVLRDTLGDSSSKNDRVSYAWLLTAPQPGIGRKLLAAVPFFYWRLGKGSKKVTSGSLRPQVDLTAPQNSMLAGLSRKIVQWSALDPLAMWARAPSRSYQSNSSDDERFHLEETISYLRHAPTSDEPDSLSEQQVMTVIARLELRKQMLGGLVDDKHAARFAEESSFEEERVRSHNWELLRQCAEKTGLYFEPFELSGEKEQYAILWYPEGIAAPGQGTALKSVWKLLKISDPYADQRLQSWEGLSFKRRLDESGRLLPEGSLTGQEIRMIPLGFYSLTYPNVPLLLVDFRDKLHVRRHEMLQRAITELTSGIIGISHLTNWYYYAGAIAYNFVSSRHGSAVSQAKRLDSYAQFQANLSLDRKIDRKLYAELSRRANSLRVSPLDSAAENSIHLAKSRYALLLSQTEKGSALLSRLNNDRRAEAATFGQSVKSSVAHNLLHMGTLGLYTQRAGAEQFNLAQLDKQRRFQYSLELLDRAIRNGTTPETAYDAASMRQAVSALTQLAGSVGSRGLREHALHTVNQVAALTRDPGLEANCRSAKLALNVNPDSALPSSPDVVSDEAFDSKADGIGSVSVESASFIPAPVSAVR